MKLLYWIMAGVLATLTLLLTCDASESYSRWRKRTINNEYRACIQQSANEPSHEGHLRHALSIYRERSKSNSWAKAAFWGHFSHYLAPYKSSDKGSELLQRLLIPELRAAINDPDELVRFEAVSIAGRIGQMSGPLVPDIVSVMKQHPGVGSGLLAIRVLGEIGPAAKEALPELMKLETTNEDARESIKLIRQDAKQ